MSRLDLLKKSTSSKTDKPTKKPSSRGGLLGGETKHHNKRKDQLDDEDLNLNDDDFQNELDDSTSPDFDIDDNDDESNEDVNIIELDIDLDNNEGLDIESDLLSDDEDDETSEGSSEELEQADSDIESDISERVEGKVFVDYSEDDIKAEVEYSFEHREEAYDKHVKVIQDGGLEISVAKVLNLGDIIRASITLTELKEQVGCEGRVVSVFPRNIRASGNENQYKYIVQFIGPNASETERVLSKYLLGYKGK
ncbi:PilZ domain-containing protein [Francisella sp. Scap27]|uniref:PilZ domain-containing protein n=1 Tax=Francisella sp. Scap27 TaxID=2589986 RepID=UPI0015C09A57|nr:PilZ domain-containing protein [Francisella sp. Scap27]QLE79817.1 PilZ domain-containing protein [Francisella sp. Scap27]